MGSTAIMTSALVALAPPSPARAEPVGLEAAANFCGPKQAFGIPYGSREKQGIHMSVVSSLVTLPESYRPFDTAEVVVTLIGRKRHTIHAQADFDSELRAREALATVRAALVVHGRILDPAANGKPGNMLYSSVEALDPKRPVGRVAETFILGSRLYFGCSDAAWKHQAEREMPPRPPSPNVAQHSVEGR